jgi:kumamolisin
MIVIDTNDSVAAKIPYLKSRGVIAVGRYYSSSAGKRVTPREAQAIAAAGLKLFTVFEDGGDPALDGDAGTTDAQRALAQANAIEQPAGSAIYFAMEHLPNGYTDKDIPGVKAYFQQIRAALQGQYKVGVYSDGVVCDALLSAGLCDYAWLSASRGFEGTKQFYLSGRWSLAQQTPLDQSWNGLSVDTNEAKPTFGEFVPGAAPAIAAAAGEPAPSFRRASTAIRSRAGQAQRRCLPYLNRSDPRSAADSGAAVVRWTVPELCKAYNWPTNLAGGGVIALVELDGGWVSTDLAAFFTSIDQPMPYVTDVFVNGTQNLPGRHVGEENDPDIEAALDIQVAAASYFVATGKPAVIRVYWAADADHGAIASAIRAATADGCDVCSISWGSDENNWAGWSRDVGRDLIADLEAAAEAATTAGMVVLASSGDNNSSDGGTTPANVDAPSSCPHVIGCGGTSKTPTSEVVWNDNPGQTDGLGTGGGYSTAFPPQSFQTGAPYPPRYLLGGDAPGNGRMVPDIAANADPNTGYWMFVHGHKIPMGGTSAVAPLYAGLFAAFGRKLGFITPKLWQSPGWFNDITRGENGAYQALSGPDPCTGLGSPIGIKLVALSGAPSTTPSVKPLAGTIPDPSTGWSGTITCSYADGVLVAPPQVTPSAGAAHGRAALAPRLLPAAAGTVTVHQGHRYSATVTLNALEQFFGNGTIEGIFNNLGFAHVSVTGSGGVRRAQGLWPGPDTTVQLDSHVGNVVDLG